MLVICNGMGRSGSTWQYNIARCLAERNGGHGVGPMATSFHGPDFAKFIKSPAIIVGKMHDVHILTRQFIDDDGMRVLYIYRDLRDAAASYIRKWGIPEEGLIERLEARLMYPYVQLKPLAHHPNVVWQRYEDMMADTFAATREIADAMPFDCSDDELAEVVEACSIPAAKRIMEAIKHTIAQDIAENPDQADDVRELIVKRELNRWDARTHVHYDHISKNEGKPGGYRETLTPKQLSLIEAKWGDWLEENGYAVGGTHAN